jgi:hypothetical protein
MRYTVPLTLVAFALITLGACEASAPADTTGAPAVTEPRDCDLPGQRDDQGRPIPQC